MTRIQIGFCLPEVFSPSKFSPGEINQKEQRARFIEALNRALDLISGHFDSAWMVDHLQFGDAAVLEGFTTLTCMAALHPQLKFGNAVLCQSFRNPALLAKMGATLQFLMSGTFRRPASTVTTGWSRSLPAPAQRLGAALPR